MKTYLRVVIFLLSCLLLTGCGPDYSWNQKLTIVVETPNGIKTASSVIRVEWSKNHFFKDGPAMKSKAVGEAVVMELREKQFLFSTMGGTLPGSRALVLAERLVSSEGSEFENVKHLPKNISLDHSLLPRFVTFRDIADPTSLRRVDPDDLDATFGCEKNTGVKLWRELGMTYKDWLAEVAKESDEYKSMKSQRVHGRLKLEKIIERSYVPRDTSGDCYRIKSVTFEITDEPITQGKVSGMFSWLKNPIGWKNPNDGLPNGYSRSNFVGQE